MCRCEGLCRHTALTSQWKGLELNHSWVSTDVKKKKEKEKISTPPCCEDQQKNATHGGGEEVKPAEKGETGDHSKRERFSVQMYKQGKGQRERKKVNCSVLYKLSSTSTNS